MGGDDEVVSAADETLMDHMGSEGRVEGSVGGEEQEEGEIMVEVVGSDVLVDGVGGHGGDRNLSGEEGGGAGVKQGLERVIESIDDGKGGINGDLASREVGDLGEQVHVVAVEEVSMRVDEEEGLERGEQQLVGGSSYASEASVSYDKDENCGIETGVEGSTTVSGLPCEQTEVVSAEKVVVTVSEEILEGELVEDGVEKVVEHVEGGGGAMDQDELVLQKSGVLDDELWNPGIEDAAGCSSSVLESSSLQTQVVAEEVSVMATDEALNHNDEVPCRGDEEGNLNCSENNHSQLAVTVCAKRDKEGAISNSAESLNQHVEVAGGGGEVGLMNEEEILHPEGNSCCLVENQQMRVETAGEHVESQSNLHVDSMSLCEEPTMPVTKVTEMDEKVCSNPNFSENVVLGDVGVDAGEVAVGCVDSGSCTAQSEDAVDNFVPNDGKMSISSTVIQDDGGSEPLAIENKVLSASDENIDYAEDQVLRVENVNELSEREAAVCSEPQSSYEQINVVNGNEVSVMDSKVNEQAAEIDEVAVMDIEEVTNIEGELATVEALDACSGKDQDVKVDKNCEKDGVHGDLESSDKQAQIDDKSDIVMTGNEDPKLGAEAVMKDGEKVSSSKIEVLDGDTCIQKDEEKDEELKVEILEKNAVEDPSIGVDSTHNEVLNDFTGPLPVTSDEVGNFEAKGESYEADEQIPEGQVLNKPMVDNLVVDLGTFVNEDGKWKSHYESVKDDVLYPEEPQFISGDTQAFDGDDGFGFSECIDGSGTGDLYLDGSGVGQDVEVQEQCTDAEHLNLYGGREVEMGEHSRSVEDKSSKKVEDVDFSLSDLVWGKVRSHPWWPGQIFDPADASEEAMKYYKKDCFLVAYFGDRTFAWNDASLLKPFSPNFSQIEKQSNSEAFQNAVNCALEEVSRRVELGLACSCIPKDVHDKIESQIFENAGIRQESSRRHRADKSAGVSSLEPDKLVEYVRALALYPSARADRLELIVTKAQLLAFNRLKGFSWLPKFQFYGGSLEENADKPELGEVIDHTVNDEQILSSKGNSSSHKRKHDLKDIVYTSKKGRSFFDSMDDDMASSPDGEDGSDWKTSSKSVSSSSGNKRKTDDLLPDGSDAKGRRISINAAKVSTTASSIPKPSFKIGECIRRAASQLTGSPSILKCNSEKIQKVDGSGETPVGYDAADNSQRGKVNFPTECSSLDEMLSQLHLTARDPMKGYGFLTTMIGYFSAFRNSICLGRYSGRQNSNMGRVGGGGKKKRASHAVGPSEEFDFDDANDSYWTDMIIQNNSEEQPSGDSKNREGEYQLVAFDPDKPPKSSRRSYSRKRYSTGNHEMAVEDANGYMNIDKRKQDMSPTELLLNFPEGESIPSVVNLNKIFRRFGPIKDSETEVDVETSRARVVFKKGSDAEVALSSAGKFSIFGPMTVDYQLNHTPSKLFYTPSISFETFPLATSQGQEDAT